MEQTTMYILDLRVTAVLLVVCVIPSGSSLRADLIGYWPFDGTAEAIVGEEGFEVNGPIDIVPDRNGMADGAFAFNGIDQYVEIPGGGGLDGVNGGTISLWANWSGFQDDDCCGGTFGAIFARQANGQFSDNIITLSDPDPDFASVVWRQSGGPAPPLITGVDTVDDGVWRHIAVTFGPDESELFLDGESQGVVAGPTPLNSNPNIPLSVGAWAGDGNGFAAASLDDVAIFDDILSAQQIQSLFDGTKTPQDVGPGTPVGEVPVPELPEGALPATIHSVSSNLGDVTGFNRRADYLVDLSGWIDGTHSLNPEGTMWLNTGTFAEPNDLDPEITFDLGSVVTLDSVKVWNYNEDVAGRPELLGRGVEIADVLVAGEDLEFTLLLEEQEFDIAPGDDTVDFGQEIELGVEARYVKFDIASNHGGDADFVGLSEVIFFGTGNTMPGDYDGNGVLDAADMDLQAAELKKPPAERDLAKFDHNNDGVVDVGVAGPDESNWGDRLIWIRNLRGTSVGDVNMDGVFDSGDLVLALQGAKYAVDAGNAEMANWVEGDWNGDMVFDSGDLVFAFQDGRYVAAATPAVPEPASFLLLIAGLIGLALQRRHAVI